MTVRPEQTASERGIALIVVLLLMAVLSGLATGFAITGQTEVQMGTNEVYFAGARAAAEAGLNRALVEILADTSTNWLSGADGVVDAGNPSSAVNADNGSLAFLLGNGPYYVDSANRYSYEIQILDDDNDLLYETPLTNAQRTAMGESLNSPYVNQNDRVILRAIGYGPNGTVVRIGRIIDTVDSLSTTTTTATVLSNPAFLVNGNLTISGNPGFTGTHGSVHANSNLTISGNPSFSKDATATNTFSVSGNPSIGGQSGGGRPVINVPNIQASDYISLADYKLSSSGSVQTLVGGVWTNCSTSACQTTGWSYSSNTWTISGNSAGSGTFYIEGDAQVSGNPNGGGSGKTATNLALSIIATGSIRISGNPKFTPENDQRIQFVTDKDLTISGNVDLDDTTMVEGQVMVREQIKLSGNPEFQGRVIVQNVTSTSADVIENEVSGNPTMTYNGTLGTISTTTTITTTGPPTYVNNVSGWMEQ